MQKKETDTENKHFKSSDQDSWYDVPNEFYYLFFVGIIVFVSIMGLLINGIYCLSHH